MTEITDIKDRIPEAVRRFVLLWGNLGERWGMNRSVTQIHALLYASKEPLAAEDIADALGIARSNVSNSLRELLSWNIIRSVPILGDRRTFYTSETDLWVLVTRIAAGRKARELDPAAAALRECVEMSRDDKSVDPVVQLRLMEMFDFVERLSRWYDQMIALPRSTIVMLMKLGGGTRAPGRSQREKESRSFVRQKESTVSQLSALALGQIMRGCDHRRRGSFWGSICTRLAQEPGIEVVSTSRRVRDTGGSRHSQTAALDIDSPHFEKRFGLSCPRPRFIARGPFQGQDYRVALASLACGAHYLISRMAEVCGWISLRRLGLPQKPRGVSRSPEPAPAGTVLGGDRCSAHAVCQTRLHRTAIAPSQHAGARRGHGRGRFGLRRHIVPVAARRSVAHGVRVAGAQAPAILLRKAPICCVRCPGSGIASHTIRRRANGHFSSRLGSVPATVCFMGTRLLSADGTTRSARSLGSFFRSHGEVAQLARERHGRDGGPRYRKRPSGPEPVAHVGACCRKQPWAGNPMHGGGHSRRQTAARRSLDEGCQSLHGNSRAV